jgi:CheY-like chemotaxis protein
MFGEKFNIVMLMFQPSVVARGLEKKLVELGNDVRPVVGDFSGINSIVDTTDLFIFNLPTTIGDDKREINTLEEIGDLIIAKNKKMILVGEKELYGELMAIYDKVDRFVWVFRPVELTELVSALDKALHGSKEDVMKRILIVDDDPEYARMVRGWIKDDYKVDIVTAGMQAITFLLKVPEDQKVDIILLDYEMPVVDGPQVFQMLRQEPATAHIPVVFLTGVGTREGVERVMSLKPDGYILKSTTRENLLSFLQNKLK